MVCMRMQVPWINELESYAVDCEWRLAAVVALSGLVVSRIWGGRLVARRLGRAWVTRVCEHACAHVL